MKRNKNNENEEFIFVLLQDDVFLGLTGGWGLQVNFSTEWRFGSNHSYLLEKKGVEES